MPDRDEPDQPSSHDGRPLRIGIVSDCYVPRLGGIEMQAHDLARNLRAAGHEVVAVTPTAGPATVDGVRVRRMDVPLLPFDVPFLPSTFRLATDLLTEEGVDVAHFHGGLASPHGLPRRPAGPGHRTSHRHHRALHVELRGTGVRRARPGRALVAVARRAVGGERCGRRADPTHRRAPSSGRRAPERHRRRGMAHRAGGARPVARHLDLGHAPGPPEAPAADAQDGAPRPRCTSGGAAAPSGDHRRRTRTPPAREVPPHQRALRDRRARRPTHP